MPINFDLVSSRPEGMDYDKFREERRSSNKLMKEYLRGEKDPQQGKHSTRYNLIKQAYKYAKVGWSELAPNQNKFLELLEQIQKNEGRKDTPGDNIQPGGNGSEFVPVGDAQPVAPEGTREGLPADELQGDTKH